jgi:ESCRT-II complex subunit VPS36
MTTSAVQSAPAPQTLRASGEKLAALAADLRDRSAAHAGGGSEPLDSGMAASLADVGIAAPVTKQSAGSRYHEQLARELARVLEPELRRERGMLALHDAYCVFNRCAPGLEASSLSLEYRLAVQPAACASSVLRAQHPQRQRDWLLCARRARGFELVSPDDLRSAAESFERLRLPLRLREFPSGVAVVQDESWSDDAACARVVDILNAAPPASAGSPAASEDDVGTVSPPGAGVNAADALGRGVRPAQFAIEAGMPVAVAREQLLLAERVGVVCRDDAPSGLTFYRNFFASVQL